LSYLKMHFEFFLKKRQNLNLTLRPTRGPSN
jgi:hypothetical protein